MTADSELQCGWCSFRCQTIFDLHIHLCGHTQTGCYIFDSTTCTGYPRFNPISCATQTDKDELSCCQDGFTQTDEELYWSTDCGTNADKDIKEETQTNSSNTMRNAVKENQADQTETRKVSRQPKQPKQKHKIKKIFLRSGSRLTKKKSYSVKKGDKDSQENSFNEVKVEPEADTGEHSSDDNAIKSDEDFAPDFNVNEETDDEYEPPKKTKKLKHKTVKPKKTKIAKEPVLSKHKCKYCEERYKTKTKLVNHILSDHPEEKAYECLDCDKAFSNSKEREKHRRKDHRKDGDNQTFQCHICSKTLSSSGALKSHLDAHKGEKNVECSKCPAKFRTTSQLTQHIKRHHEISYDHMCSRCGKLFKTNDDLYHHKILCSGIRKFKCEVCEKMFFTNRVLRNHMRSHTGETPYVCDVCGNRYRHSDSLNSHKLTHTGERPFVCSFCPQSFVRRTAYRDHMKIHNQDLRYVCPYCKKSFVKKCNMDVHVLQHTGETPFKCDRCGQGFKQNVLLKRHKVQQHKNDLSREEIVKCTSTTTIKLGLQSADDMTRNELPASAMQLGLPENPGWLQPFPTFQ